MVLYDVFAAHLMFYSNLSSSLLRRFQRLLFVTWFYYCY